MSEKRFTTNGYYINDNYKDGRKWLVNNVEAKEIVNVMNGLDTNARQSRKAISKIQKENEQLRKQVKSSETTSNATSHYNAFLESKITTLEQENEELRQFINKGRKLSVKEFIDNINENELLKNKIRELEKDNEQLKQKLEILGLNEE